jgi:hypothetical protein
MLTLYDPSLFYKKNHSIIVILVYVKDLIVAGTDVCEIQNIKFQLDIVFSIEDLGNLRYFLGLKIARSKLEIFITQRKYTLNLLEYLWVYLQTN